MKTTDFSQQSDDYRRVEQAIRFLEANFRRQPDLDAIANSVNLSKYHFHRIFKRWAGVSPIQFLHFLTLDYTKQKLSESRVLLDTALDAGLSGPGRLHDLFVTFEAMTPGEFKNLGAGVEIEYDWSFTPFGECLLATTRRGICHLSFVENRDRYTAFEALQSGWPKAVFRENPRKARDVVHQLFNTAGQEKARPFHLLLKGTNFQVNVWKALLAIPKGTVVSYRDIARYMGRPRSTRAVANAVAINPIGYLIPCHRVITSSGKIHQYRWGATRKKAILGWEAAERI